MAAFHGADPVGWSWGFQESSTTFKMLSSAVSPGHRRKGLYRALLQETMKEALRVGFQVIYSRHTPTNNAVIIPKLQAGFVITALDVNDLLGLPARS